MKTFEPWVSLDTLAKYLNIKPDTIYKWCERNKTFPCHKVGRLWRFKLSEIDNYITKKRK